MKHFSQVLRLALAVPLLLAVVPAPAAAEATSAACAYTSLPPVRVMDTRDGAAVPGRGSLALSFSSHGVPSGAGAVALNLTVTGGSQSGYASVFPAGGSGGTSVLNWSPGQTVANLTVVGLGSGGQVTLFNGSPGAAHFVVDLEGYFAPPSGTSGQLVSLPPFRLADTRTGSGSSYSSRTMGPGSVLDLTVSGAGGVPASGVSAVVLNVTSTDSTAGGYFTVWPTGSARPLTSNLNFTDGDTVDNRVIVGVGTGGQVSIFSMTGSADAVVDVSGYFTDDSASYGQGAWFTAMEPVRLMDTRRMRMRLGPGGMQTLQVAGMAGIPPGALSAFLNVTAADTNGGSYLTVSPDGSASEVSDVSCESSDVSANSVVAELSSTGSGTIYNASGSTDLVVDAFGYFTRSVAPGA